MHRYIRGSLELIYTLPWRFAEIYRRDVGKYPSFVPVFYGGVKMSVKCDNHFLFSDFCYYDLDANTITDISTNNHTRNIPISGEERIVLRKLIEDYPKSVHKETLCKLIGGTCGEERIRKVIDKLKKRHKCLKEWLPRASQGEYRLQNPNGSNGKEKGIGREQQSVECTLKSTGICVRPNFVKEARQDIFAALDESFDESHVVFLQGIGGIGKSEAAKHWALKKKKERLFDTVVFAQLNSESENSNVQSLIADDTIFVIAGSFRVRDEEESMDVYFQRKLAKIKQITDERTLIIIDNYDIDDPKLAELFTGPYRLLVTTRNKQEGYDFPLIPVTEIQGTEYLKDIFFKNLGDEREDINREDPYIEKLFELVSNHTLTIEIIAKALVNSSDTLETLYQKIGNPEQYTLMRNVDGLVVRNFSEKALTSYECIRRLFNLSRLEQDEDFEYKSQVLVFLAAMPTRGIELSLFKKWSDNRIIRSKNSLVRKSWLRQDTVTGVKLISMHPLIREIVWSELNPTLGKCSLLITKIIEDDLLQIDGLFHQPIQVKKTYTNIAYSLFVSFPQYDLEYFDVYFTLQSIFSNCSKSELSINIAHGLLRKLEEVNETSTWRYGQLKGRIATLHAFYHRRLNQYIMSLYCDAESVMSQTAINENQLFSLALLYRNKCSVLCNAWFWGNTLPDIDTIGEAKACIEKGTGIIAELRGKLLIDTTLDLYLSTLLVWKSRIEIIGNNLSDAEKLIVAADEEFLRLGYRNASDKATVFDVMATIHGIQRDYDCEIYCLCKAQEICLEYFGKYYRSAIERATKLARAYQNNNQPEEAIKILTDYQKVAEEMLGSDAALSVAIRNQLNQLILFSNKNI